MDPEEILVESFAGQGSSELISTVGDVKANDTSFGVSHWPRSELEGVVYKTSNHLNSRLLEKYPIGEDTKVMGLRNKKKIFLTASIPLIAQEVSSISDYKKVKGVMTAHAITVIRDGVEFAVLTVSEISYNTGLEDSFFKME